MKNVATTVACFAVSLMLFTACDEIEDLIEESTEQDADIVAFSFTGIEGNATIDKTAHTVSAKAGKTVDITAIVADFALSTGASVTVGNKPQTSKQTVNNFTSPLTYRVTSGDGATVNNWTVTVTSEETGGQAGAFTKRTFNSVKEVMDFFPEGVFVYAYENQSWNGDIDLYAKGADGSFTYCEFNGDPESSYYNDVNEWRVWEGENYHGIYYTNKENVTHWWQVKGEYPGETLTQSATKYFGAVYEGNPADAWISILSMTPFIRFITSNDCETAVFEKEETIAGIPCKKYTIAGYGGTTASYWVLENGFCIKYDNTAEYAMTDFYLVKGELGIANYDAVLKKHYHNSHTFSDPTSVADMQILTHMKKGEWLASSGPPEGVSNWVIPWTAGGINHITLWYDLGKTFPHTYSLNLDQREITDAERLAYFGQVKAIPYMAVKSDLDTDSPEFHAMLLMGLQEMYAESKTEAEILEMYNRMIENYKTNRTVEFKGDNSDYGNTLTIDFGDYYYYIKYDFNLSTISNQPFLCGLTISWVKMTIV
jgi:hypothetical protein